MDYTPRVAAVHDLSGFGRCALTVALPVLAAMGAQCCPLPTAYLSAHTGFPPSRHAVFTDLTGGMAGTVAHWQELNVTFHAVYSGFLGSAEQIGALESLIHAFRAPDTLVLVDPVMGDHGKLYRTYTAEMCKRMAVLVKQAGLITPNLTEAAILLGEDYDPAPTPQKADAWLERLSGNGVRSVALTGVSRTPGWVGCASYDAEQNSLAFCDAPVVEGVFSGTGDLFASVLLGARLRGEPLPQATETAVSFVQRCAAHTSAAGLDPITGPNFEPFLKELMQ